MSIALGTLHTFAHVFVNGAGSPTDPTVVKFYLREEVDGTELEWTYAAVPVAGTDYPVGMNPIVRNGAGDFEVDYIARKPERVSAFFLGTGAVADGAPSTLFVRHASIAILDPPST